MERILLALAVVAAYVAWGAYRQRRARRLRRPTMPWYPWSLLAIGLAFALTLQLVPGPMGAVAGVACVLIALNWLAGVG